MMAKKLIELQDGILIEVSEDYKPTEKIEEAETEELAEGQRSGLQEVSRSDARALNEISKYGYFKSDFKFKDKIKEKILEVTQSMGEAWVEMNQTAQAASASVELGFNFEAKGNIFIAEASAKANIKVTINWDFSKIKQDDRNNEPAS